MYEYQYIYVETGGGFWMDNSKARHRAVIEEESKRGWRYVGFVPMEFTGRGGIRAMDLIFERPAKEE